MTMARQTYYCDNKCVDIYKLLEVASITLVKKKGTKGG